MLRFIWIAPDLVWAYAKTGMLVCKFVRSLREEDLQLHWIMTDVQPGVAVESHDFSDFLEWLSREQG